MAAHVFKKGYIPNFGWHLKNFLDPPEALHLKAGKLLKAQRSLECTARDRRYRYQLAYEELLRHLCIGQREFWGVINMGMSSEHPQIYPFLFRKINKGTIPKSVGFYWFRKDLVLPF